MSYKIGDKVKVAHFNDNENYNAFRNKVLIIDGVTRNTDEHFGYDEGMGDEYLYNLTDLDGNLINCALYDYELELA